MSRMEKVRKHPSEREGCRNLQLVSARCRLGCGIICHALSLYVERYPNFVFISSDTRHL